MSNKEDIKKRGAVFFGPFIGEFGWELLFWQGWVRKVCLGEYKDHYKIVASFPGREAFYPYADEFWPHPEELMTHHVSQRGYITDFWKNGSPKGEILVKTYKFGIIPRYKLNQTEHKLSDFSVLVDSVLEGYKKRLPKETIYYCPFLLNHYKKDNLEFGVKWEDDLPRGDRYTTKRIDFKSQLLEIIQPTIKGVEAFNNIYNEDKPLIAVFPRNRTVRRADKNWSREKYVDLIEMLKKRYADQYKIAIIGEPEGTYFAEGVPNGTLDLINVPKYLRMDIQVAALQKARIALGSMSGAILFALACGTPSVTWGYRGDMQRYHEENYLSTEFVFYPRTNPSPIETFEICNNCLNDSNNGYKISYRSNKAIKRISILFHLLRCHITNTGYEIKKIF